MHHSLYIRSNLEQAIRTYVNKLGVFKYTSSITVALLQLSLDIFVEANHVPAPSIAPENVPTSRI